MPQKNTISSAQKSRESAAKLQRYLDSTPPSKIPTNQFKKASRKKICQILQITYSTIGSNPKLAELFDQLDLKLTSFKPEASSVRPHSKHGNDTLAKRYQKLEQKNLELSCQLERYKHFELTGRMVRE